MNVTFVPLKRIFVRCLVVLEVAQKRTIFDVQLNSFEIVLIFVSFEMLPIFDEFLILEDLDKV